MKNDKVNPLHQVGQGIFDTRFGKWLKKYKWHFLIWFGLFIYGYVTDLLLYPTAYFSKCLIHFLTHHVLLFYSLLYCLNSFSSKKLTSILIGVFRFVLVMGGFIVLRIFLNYQVFSVLDQYMGFEKDKIDFKVMNINALFWITEQSVRVVAFYIFQKLILKERELRKSQSVNYQIQIERLEDEKRTTQIETNLKSLETTLSNLVHETKTPLTILSNCLYTYTEKIGNSYELDLMKSSLKKMEYDINNLFDLQRIKQEKELYDNESITNFSAILNECLNSFDYYRLTDKPLLESNIAPGIFCQIDPAAANRIINNLIENAVKYSNPSSPISITLEAVSGQLKFSVSNSAENIPEEGLENIFIPYYQLNNKKKNIQGLGLGLPLIKSIINSAGGKIEVQNLKQNNGMSQISFQVTLTALAGEAQANDYTVAHPLASFDNGNISTENPYRDGLPDLLIVEDNQALNGFLLNNLCLEFNVRQANSGSEALDKILSRKPDLIISDVMMDGMGGFELAQKLQRSPDLNFIPIIFMSARGEESAKIEGVQYGAVDYIVKPFSYPFLLNKIKSLLEVQQNQERRIFRAVKNYSETITVSNVPGSIESFSNNCRKYNLTNREIEIAQLFCSGKTAVQIGEEIYIATRTVTTHISNIYEKVQVNSKIDLAIKLFN